MVFAITPPIRVRFGAAFGSQYQIHNLRGRGLGLCQRMSSLVMEFMSESGRVGGQAAFFRIMRSLGESVKKAKKSRTTRVDAGLQSSPTEEFPEHLVVMVNGIVGSADDWKYAAEQFIKKLPGKVTVHRSQSNYFTLTFDGVDMMGERLSEEILALVKQRPGLKKISFVAHSLGGLIARYAIGRLYGPAPDGEGLTGRIAGLEPVNFITVATPHLGSRGHKQFPILCGISLLERSASQTAHLLVGRTGRHLFLTDGQNGKPPLLLQMVSDSDDMKFRSALTSFKRCVAYANANFDHMVGWRTSSIRRQHELPNPRLLVGDEQYPHVMYVDRRQVPTGDRESSSAETSQSDDLEETMIRGLAEVPWERIDVSFKKSTQRFIAHSTIQVKTYWMNSDGADVIFHMIDNFVV